MLALTDGEREILAELAVDASGWTDNFTADWLDSEADVMAEIYEDLDAMRDSQRWLEAHEATKLEAMQSAVWAQPPY